MSKFGGGMMLVTCLAVGCNCIPEPAPTDEKCTACGPCGRNGTPCGPDRLGVWENCECRYWCEAPNGDCVWFGAGETCLNPCEGPTCAPPAP